MESDSEGTLLLCNNLSGGNYPPEYAYTLLYPDGETKDFDPFAPVSVTGYMTAFAQKPMTASGDEFKFIKFQTDSLFSINNGNIEPLLKLDFGMEVISKEELMSVGQYNSKELIEYCLRNKKLVGIDKVYETSDLMVFIPVVRSLTGFYFWLDKKEGVGYRVSSTNEINSEVVRVVDGSSIIDIMGGMIMS